MFSPLLSKMNENLNTISNDMKLQKDIIADLRETTKGPVNESVQTAIEASMRLNESTENIAHISSDLRTLFGSLPQM